MALVTGHRLVLVEGGDGEVEAAGEHHQVDEADRGPDQAADERVHMQIRPQDAGQHHAEARQRDEGDDVLRCAPATLPDREPGDDRDIDESERDQRSEVDERGNELQRESGSEQADEADQDDVERGGARLRVDVAEEAPREDVVAPHHEEHAGHGGVRGESGGQRRAEAGRGQRGLKHRAADLEADLRQCAVLDRLDRERR